ncbi:MAG: hypothetical protein ACE5FC_05550, partial [Myxococcota bacterium]
DAALAAIARQSEGCMRDALTILDQLVAYTSGKVGEDAVRDALGLIDRNLLFDLAHAVIQSEPARCLEALRQLDTQGADARRTIREILVLLRDLVVLAAVKDPGKAIDAPEAELGRLREIAEGASPETLHALFDLFLKGAQEIDFASQPFLVLEMCVLKAAHLRPLVPVSDLLRRLGSLEEGTPLPAPSSDARSSGGGGQRAPGSVRGGAPRKSAPPGKPPRREASPGTGAKTAPPVADRAGVDESTPPPITDADLPESDETSLESFEEGAVASPWGRYLALVGERAPLLASILAHGRFAGLTEDRLEVSFAVGLHGDMLGDKADLAARLAEECFGRPLRVEVVNQAAGGGDRETAAQERKSTKERESDRERALRKEALDHDAVQQARQVLGGEIKEIKTL